MDKYIETWHIFEKLYREKRVRAIGVSNFKRPHLENLMNKNSIVPAINQIELHPYFQDLDTINFCKNHNIRIESYSPLGGHGSHLLQEEVIKEIANKHDKAPAQIVLRWHIQNDYVVIPKASSLAHLQANQNIFDFQLSQTEMATITSLSTGKRRGSDPNFFNSGIKTGLVQLAHKFGIVHWPKEK